MKPIKIGGELESTATGGIVAAASAIKDKDKDKYQNEINQEIDDSLADRYTKGETYSKQQIDTQIEAQIVNVATREKYATLSATAEDVSIDTILPAAGSEDTIYRAANWDGTEYNTSYWTEYAWVQDDETTGHYVPLAIKNMGLDTTPIPDSLNPVSSGGVADACGYLDEVTEYIKVETDADDNLLHSVSKEDGAYWFHKLKSPTLDKIEEDILAIKEEAEEEVEQAIEDSQEELAAHYDYYNVSKHHSITDTVNVYTVNEGWTQIDYNGSLGQYDPLDIYQIGEQCNYGGDINHSYESTIAQRGVAPATITQEYSTRTKFTLEEALAILPAEVISSFTSGQRICFVDTNNIIEEWELQELGSWVRTNPYVESDNPEWLAVEVDANGRLLSGTKADGSHYSYNMQSESIQHYETLTETFYHTDDYENRSEVTLDAEEKALSYRKENGVKVECAGIETPFIYLSDDGIERLANNLGQYSSNIYKEPNLPKYGVTNIKQETFYLTADERVSSIDDVYLIFDFADTDANAADRMTIAHYYIKETLTDNGDGTYSRNADSVRLQHYAWGKVSKNEEDNKFYAKDPVRKLDDVCYYADSLGFLSTSPAIGSKRNKVIEGYTREAPYDSSLQEGRTVQTLVEVVEVTGPVCVNAWTVEDWDGNAVSGTDIGKKHEHKCIADIDFGNYLSKSNVTITVKHQGNSTQGYRKRNFRYTFYKNSSYAKKDKIKIGSMLRLSKYNLKANWRDDSRIKELILYRVFYDIWYNRPIINRYNWDNQDNGLYNGASGNIVSFPCRLDVAGEFYGIYIFSLPKDGKNYLIDDEDEDTGMLICGSGNTDNDWGVTLPYRISAHYDSEMDDDDLDNYPGIIAAMEEWTDFINGRLYKGTDGNTYNVSELTEVDNKMYVTSTLEDGQVVEGSVVANIVKFDRKNISERFDVLGFIDYAICLQVFLMTDSMHNNIMFYAGPEKKKIFPFFYDLDSAITMNRGADADIFEDGVSLSGDLSLWRNFIDVYWDDIVNRYCELRKTYLSMPYLTLVYKNVKEHIPAADYVNENSKWSSHTSASVFEDILEFTERRIKILDEEYFKI